MAALKAIKGKIRSIEKTRKVTRAMEAVSAVKMRKSQAIALAGRPYARAAMTILSRASAAGDIARHPLAKERAVKNSLYLVVTSDKGLAGSLNSATLKEAVRAIGSNKEGALLITLGRKATEFFTKRGFNVIASHENIADGVSAEEISFITEKAVASFMSGACDELVAIYTNFYSTLTQRPVTRRLLPLTPAMLTEMVDGIVPQKGRFSNLRKEPRKDASAYLIEPGPEEVLEGVLPLLLNVAVYHALLESKASEHSARMVAMKNASDKAKEISHDLTIVLNKQRQALITREVSEIIGGIEAMAN